MSVGNADKGLMPAEEVKRRVQPFIDENLPLVLTQVSPSHCCQLRCLLLATWLPIAVDELPMVVHICAYVDCVSVKMSACCCLKKMPNTISAGAHHLTDALLGCCHASLHACNRCCLLVSDQAPLQVSASFVATGSQ